mmetsp:Transcript_17578/g.57013  ORF Transcript_17578/g.57013 Transcript_17578/m.57013 type:complete len:390 (+) Transcript_17578:646-1815(+)
MSSSPEDDKTGGAPQAKALTVDEYIRLVQVQMAADKESHNAAMEAGKERHNAAMEAADKRLEQLMAGLKGVATDINTSMETVKADIQEDIKRTAEPLTTPLTALAIVVEDVTSKVELMVTEVDDPKATLPGCLNDKTAEVLERVDVDDQYIEIQDIKRSVEPLNAPLAALATNATDVKSAGCPNDKTAKVLLRLDVEAQAMDQHADIRGLLRTMLTRLLPGDKPPAEPPPTPPPPPVVQQEQPCPPQQQVQAPVSLPVDSKRQVTFSLFIYQADLPSAFCRSRVNALISLHLPDGYVRHWSDDKSSLNFSESTISLETVPREIASGYIARAVQLAMLTHMHTCLVKSQVVTSHVLSNSPYSLMCTSAYALISNSTRTPTFLLMMFSTLP